MDNILDTINEPTRNGEENIPLQSFYAELKENGFSVTPLQIIHSQKVIMQYANWVKNEGELCQYLSPIFAGSEEEQLLFKKIFDKHFKQEIAKPISKQQLSIERKLKQHWRKLIIIYGGLAILIIAGIVYPIIQTKNYDPNKISLSIKDKNESNPKAPINTKTNTQLELITICKYDNKPTALEVATAYNWGDNSTTDALPTHIYIRAGVYKLTAYISVLYKSNIIKKDTLHSVINVCDVHNSLSIKILSAQKTIVTGEKIRCIAITNSPQHFSHLQWLVDGVNIGNSKEIDIDFADAGTHRITCSAFYDSINSPCSIYKDTSIIIYNKSAAKQVNSKPAVLPNKEEDVKEPPKTPNKFLGNLYTSLIGIFSLLVLFFMALYARQLKKTGAIKNKVLDKYKKLTTSFTTKKETAILPFKNRNYVPAQQSELDDITKLLRRRVKDTVTFLNIEKTIGKSIEKQGMFTPVQDVRTRQSEYLILIDETSANSLQVKLFEYLVTILKKQGVLAETFYYKKHPNFCYNIYEPKGISLEKLFGKYQRHILLIMGNGYQLINKTENKFDEIFLALLNRWQHKAIITTVSFLDWQEKEKNILLPKIPIVPADMEGLVLLAEILTKGNDIDIVARLNRNSGTFYKAHNIDFEQMWALQEYCSVAGWNKLDENGKWINVFFEWVLTLSIYPKLRWEIILAMGNAISDKYNLRHQLNYTILLRLVRISWMQDGVIKDNLRFEMLKKLSKENEQTARETLLLLLKEIPQQEIENHTAIAAEKEVQQIINEFSLYAHDPVFYSSYHESKYMFEKLWQNNQLNDKPTESYFKNEARQWRTLINQYDNNNEAPYNVGADEYLLSNQKEETLLSKVYLALAIISAVVLVSSIGALRVLYIWDNVL